MMTLVLEPSSWLKALIWAKAPWTTTLRRTEECMLTWCKEDLGSKKKDVWWLDRQD